MQQEEELETREQQLGPVTPEQNSSFDNESPGTSPHHSRPRVPFSSPVLQGVRGDIIGFQCVHTPRF